MAGIPQVGDEFGPYRIVGVLGRGGMGVVLEAEDLRLGRSVALKVLTPGLSEDPEFRERFEHEAAVLARLDSPHIVHVHDFGEHDGCLFLTAQLVRGGDLSRYLVEHGPMAPELAADLVAQLCEALVDAHAAGVIHRDIKPSNILLRDRGGVLQAYLCDFGIAATEASGHTRTGQVVGSTAYMAPERHHGVRADERSDLYSVGCVLWALLSGSAPYVGTDLQVANAHAQAPIPQFVATTAQYATLNEILLRAMAKDPAERYGSPRELGAALRAVTVLPDSTAVLATTVPLLDEPTRIAPVPPGPRPRPRWLLPLLALLLVALLGGVLTAVLLGGDDAPEQPVAGSTPSSTPRASKTPTPKAPVSTTPSTTPVLAALVGPGCDALPRSGAGSPSGMATSPVITALSANPLTSTFVAAVRQAGLEETLDTAGGLTVFAPTDAAFAAMSDKDREKLLEDDDKLTELILGHVVAGRLGPDEVVGTQQTLGGGDLKIGTEGRDGDLKIQGGRGASVVCGNIGTANATVYLVDGVLGEK